ncbi:hypothetical protein GOV14_02995 [Candidatus Pacearchaeota archaeon]|nr:hypothetical protein [Candidatus Pacearchaeota archaeon]
MTSKKIQNFTIKFFQNLKASLERGGDILIVKDVPSDFEKFSRRSSPYFLVFDEKKMTGKTELIAKGSSLLKSMTDYVSDSGSATILRIKFEADAGNVFKGHLNFIDCRVDSSIKKQKNNFFSRFTIQSTFQYLNKRDQIINVIHVHNGKIVDGDLSNYPVVEGKKEDVPLEELRAEYELVKKQTKELLHEKIEEIKVILDKDLKKGTKRIKKHFDAQRNEALVSMKQDMIKIKSLAIEMTRRSGLEYDKIKRKIQRLKENIERVKKNNKADRILREEEFAITDEKHKHSLNIDNKLINTTVIYYPRFIFETKIKNNKCTAKAIFEYNPLINRLNPIVCNNCNKKTKHITLCSNGHIICPKCNNPCGDCGENYCKKCLSHECSFCTKKMCKDCKLACFKCKKVFCQNHLNSDNLSENLGCNKCLKMCPQCNTYSDKDFFKKNNANQTVCQKCVTKSNIKNLTDQIFHN